MHRNVVNVWGPHEAAYKNRIRIFFGWVRERNKSCTATKSEKKIKAFKWSVKKVFCVRWFLSLSRAAHAMSSRLTFQPPRARKHTHVAFAESENVTRWWRFIVYVELHTIVSPRVSLRAPSSRFHCSEWKKTVIFPPRIQVSRREASVDSLTSV